MVESEVPTDEATAKSAGRGTLSIVLILVAALLAPLTVVAAWAQTQIEDTDRYVATVGPLADDPEVQAYVAAALADGLCELLGVDELPKRCPSSWPPGPGDRSRRSWFSRRRSNTVHLESGLRSPVA